MVKKRYFFLISIFIHGVLALSITPHQRIFGRPQQNFVVTLLSMPQAKPEKETITPVKTSPQRIKQKKALPTAHPTKTENSSSGPLILYNPPPQYPDYAKAKGHEGLFNVKIIVTPRGDVERIQIISIKGDVSLFEAEISRAISSWKFSPCSQAIAFEIPVSFLLDG